MHDLGHPLYAPLRILHILGAMTYFGALAVALWWKLGVDRSGDAPFAARTHRRLRKLDGQLVGPAALVTFAAGYAMVRFLGGRISQHAFVIVGLVLLFASLGLWHFGMRKLGDRLAEDAESAEAQRMPLGPAYGRRSAMYVLSAGAALALVVAAVVVMVLGARGAIP